MTDTDTRAWWCVIGADLHTFEVDLCGSWIANCTSAGGFAVPAHATVFIRLDEGGLIDPEPFD